MRRQLALRRPYLSGEDVAAVQLALGFTGAAVDGVYGPRTAARVRGWKRELGYPPEKVNAILGRWGQALLFGEVDPPAHFRERAAQRRLRVVAPLDTDPGARSEFAVLDAEGAPADDGRRYHAGKDWFAPAGSLVRAPVTGTIVEARSRLRATGQTFGGTVKIEDAAGRVWVFRHVDPQGVSVGRQVDAGEEVATVSRWRDGSPHAHLEVWRSLSGGYDFENMLDPMIFFG